MTAAPVAVPSAKIRPWPALPYPGLDYYRAEDRPLLAGRERDVQWFSDLLSHPAARVVMLHGMTGAGKSSFLRAGLIPALDEVGGYHFLRREGEEVTEALFIRCSATPVDQMAAQVHRFATASHATETPRGRRPIDMSGALLGCETLQAFMERAREPGGLVESLRHITARLPSSLVLVVDQAEEVFTLNQTEEMWPNRTAFFRVLRDLQSSSIDLRVIVTLRTEFHGRLFDAISFGGAAGEALRSYHLADLDRAALLEAIIRPTRQDDVAGFGVPFAAYGFDYEPGLPERIADEIVSRRFQGATGPVVQLVCSGLHEGLAEVSAKRISVRQYEAGLGVEGQIVSHLKDASVAAAAAIRSLPNPEFAESKLRETLDLLVQRELDGAVVACVRKRSWFEEEATRRLKLTSAGERDSLFGLLMSRSLLILREIRQRDELGRESIGITLAHDCLAVGITKWVTPEMRQARREAAVGAVSFAILVGGGVGLAVFLWILSLVLSWFGWMSEAYFDGLLNHWATMTTVIALIIALNPSFLPGFVKGIAGVTSSEWLARVQPGLDRLAFKHHQRLFAAYSRLGLIDPEKLPEK